MKHERQGTRYLQYNVTQKIYFAQICRTQEVYFSPVEFYHYGLSRGEHRCRRENSECAQACSSPGHPVRSFPGHTGSSKFTFNTSEHLSSIFLIILLVLSIHIGQKRLPLTFKLYAGFCQKYFEQSKTNLVSRNIQTEKCLLCNYYCKLMLSWWLSSPSALWTLSYPLASPRYWLNPHPPPTLLVFIFSPVSS